MQYFDVEHPTDTINAISERTCNGKNDKAELKRSSNMQCSQMGKIEHTVDKTIEVISGFVDENNELENEQNQIIVSFPIAARRIVPINTKKGTTVEPEKRTTRSAVKRQLTEVDEENVISMSWLLIFFFIDDFLFPHSFAG